MKIKSFAKINLGLEVKGKRKDNYHEIAILFQSIDLYDCLEFLPHPANRIFLQGDDESIAWDASNLIFQAARILQEKCSVSAGIQISVNKNIPPGRGLGGGSSNAAVTLYVLNKMWELGLSKEDLVELGKKLGADVPFFFEGGLCLGLERGDQVFPLPDLRTHFCVLALPPFPIRTAFIYQNLLLQSLTSKDKESKMNRFLKTQEFGFLENKLEETVFSFYPQLKDFKSLFQSQGAELSLVTGTGSAVFGLFKEKEKAEKCLEKIKERSEAMLVETVSRKKYWEEIEAGV